MALPSNVNYGTVVGQFLLAYADGTDPDLFPDGVPAKGSIYFRPSPAKLLDASSTPNPVTILPAVVEATLDSEGYVFGPDGTRGITLVATDDADLNPTGWTWTAEFRLTDQDDVPVSVASYSFQLPSDTTVDLTTLSPVPDANGTYYLVGPKGDKGDTGDTGPAGEAATITVGTTTTGAEGTSASVVNSGTTSAAILDFTIPRGDTGATGPQGDAATIAVGTVTTVAPSSPATVTNVGTSAAAIFDFEIPKGDTGDVGAISATLPITYDNATATIGFDDTAIGVIDGGSA